jgi:N-acyl-D-amino-acid deacylase
VFAADLNKQVPQAYGAWHLEAMDAHGGWLASAVDLARFACAFDDPTNCKILNQDSIQEMFARPPGLAGADADGKPKPVYYSLGWSNRVLDDGKSNRWHTGSLPGTATILVRRHDGRNWAVLMNARMSPYASHLGGAIDSLVHKAADEVTAWPEYDLFEQPTHKCVVNLFVVPPLGGFWRYFLFQDRLKAGLQTSSCVCSEEFQ